VADYAGSPKALPVGWTASLDRDERAGFTRCDPFGDYRPDLLSVFMQKELP